VIGDPLPRRAPNWFWFVLAALAALYSTWAALFGFAQPWLPAGFAIAAAFIALRPKLRNLERETVQVDDTGVTRVDGAVRQQIRWDEVTEIRVIAVGTGPWREELHFALGGPAGQSCVVPHEAALRTRLLDDLRARFPTLDNETLAEAMASPGKRHFVIWGKSPAPSVQ
jgi:hypothetical protein